MNFADNSENAVTLICQKLQNFSQNSFEDNAITLSIVDKILSNKISLPEVESEMLSKRENRKHDPKKRNN